MELLFELVERSAVHYIYWEVKKMDHGWCLRVNDSLEAIECGLLSLELLL